jgi:hypothetical protein
MRDLILKFIMTFYQIIIEEPLLAYLLVISIIALIVLIKIDYEKD